MQALPPTPCRGRRESLPLVPPRDALQHHSCGLMGELERARARVTKVNVAIQKISYLISQLNHTTQAFAIHSSPSPPLTLSNTKSVAAPSLVRATHAAALVTKRSRTPPILLASSVLLLPPQPLSCCFAASFPSTCPTP